MKYFSTVLILIFISITALPQTDTVFNQTDANNLKQGYWKRNYPNGKLMYTAFFKDNRPSGIMKRYYESGRLRAIMNYSADGENAFARLFYENGNPVAEGKYSGTHKDSIWTYYSYYSKTVTARESWVEGIRNGMMVSYFDNGDISEKIEWKDSKKTGLWEQFFKGNVLKMKARLVDNKLEGEFFVYAINGTPYITGNYRNNLREGKWTFFDETGKVQKVLNYQAGIAAESDKLDAEQQEFFRNIDDAQGKYEEPDETDFLSPSR